MTRTHDTQSTLPSLVLIGLRGCGKSTVGSNISAQFPSHTRVDLDEVVKQRMGAHTIADAWREQGEAVFRAHERDALSALLLEPKRILSLGGGTPTAPGVAELLRSAQSAARCCIVYLSAPADVLGRRIIASGTADRPSLIGTNAIDEIQQVLHLRDSLYTSLACTTIDATSPLDDVASCVIDVWKARADSRTHS